MAGWQLRAATINDKIEKRQEGTARCSECPQHVQPPVRTGEDFRPMPKCVHMAVPMLGQFGSLSIECVATSSLLCSVPVHHLYQLSSNILLVSSGLFHSNSCKKWTAERKMKSLTRTNIHEWHCCSCCISGSTGRLQRYVDGRRFRVSFFKTDSALFPVTR